MEKLQTILIEKGITTHIKLNRPKVHNAMNEIMISELTYAFKELPLDNSIRLIVLQGNGKSFCAGADLNYMKDIANFGYDENYEDGLKLATLFKSIYQCPIPTIAVVHGSAFGGANGLLCSCDIVLADENTTFAFSEVKLGIGPATISPFVIKRIGEYSARDLMLTGRRIKGQEAKQLGLVNNAFSNEDLYTELDKYIHEFNTSAPESVCATKKIISSICNDNMNIEDEIEYTASCIAKLRQAHEGQEGMSAFLEKRKPNWVK